MVGLQNPAALAAEIRRQVAQSYGGNVSRAADAVGLSQSTLSGLVRGSRRRVTLRTFVALYKLLPDNRAKWGSWVLPTESQLALAAYMFWLRQWFNRVQEEKGAGESVTTGVPGLTWRGVASEWDAVLDRVAAVTPEVVRSLANLAKDRRFFTDRVALVILRILEPLIDSHSSGGIERHHTELSDDELAKFVRAGLDREMILLLGREGDIERAQAVRPVSVAPSGPSISREIERLLRSNANTNEPTPMLGHAIRAVTPK